MPTIETFLLIDKYFNFNLARRDTGHFVEKLASLKKEQSRLTIHIEFESRPDQKSFVPLPTKLPSQKMKVVKQCYLCMNFTKRSRAPKAAILFSKFVFNLHMAAMPVLSIRNMYFATSRSSMA